MKALAEKLAKLFLVLLFLIGIEGIDVHAAVSYPNMLPDAETVGCEIKTEIYSCERNILQQRQVFCGGV